MGNTLRRLSAKCAGTIAKSNRCVEYGKVQLCYGTQRGAQAAAHATRLYVRQEHSPDQILLKIDMKNASNSISRDALLATVFAKNPLIYNYTEAAYAKPSFLFYRDKIILSDEGAQQGDPEGPPLFSDTINDTIRSLCSKLNLWYLDDGNLAGTVEDVLNDYTTLRSAFLAMRLEVNPRKCELVFLGCPLKKNGGVRPIDVGGTVRRLPAKCASKIVCHTLAKYFSPLQMGVGRPNGAEAAVHAARSFLSAAKDDDVLIKLDFENALSTLRRDAITESILQLAPDFNPFFLTSNKAHSSLVYGDYVIGSQEGLQQGDPIAFARNLL